MIRKILNYLKGFMLSWNMLTIIPLFKIHNFFKGINGISAMFYPFVGFLIGLVLYVVSLLLDGVVQEAHLRVIIFVLWVVITGGLHLDGFSDTIDGLFVEKKKALEVMKDSHIGGMGMIFSVVFLIFKASSVIFIKDLGLLPFILMFSRLSVVVVIYMFDYISKGVTTLIKEELDVKLLVFAMGYAFFIGLIFSKVWLGVFALVFGVALASLFNKRYGGLNGDMYGFIIEVCEVFLLNVAMILS